MNKEKIINSVLGAQFLFQYIDDTEEPFIRISTISKKNKKITADTVTSGEMIKHFQRMIKDIGYQFFELKVYELNTKNESIDINDNSIIYTTTLKLK